MTKQVKNNLVTDIKRDHVMTDRVINNQLNWELNNVVKNLEWSINNKLRPYFKRLGTAVWGFASRSEY